MEEFYMKKYTEIELEAFEHKNIRVTCIDGMTVHGLCLGMTRAVDNIPEIAEIVLRTKQYKNGTTSILLTEIKDILEI